MSDFSMILWCLTILIISFQAFRFAKWYFSNETYLCDRLESADSEIASLREENKVLREQLKAVDITPFTDLSK